MATRLPIPGDDKGSWGTILNSYLRVAHNEDGTIKNNAVTSNAIADGAVTTAKLSSSVQSIINNTTGTNTGDQTLAVSGNILTISGTNGNSVSLPDTDGEPAPAAWGSIDGALGNQSDLQTALADKLTEALVLSGSAPIPSGTTPRFIIRT